MILKRRLIHESNMAQEESVPYELPSTDRDFSSRSKDIFAGLDSLERKHEEKQRRLDGTPETRREARKLWKDEPVVDRVDAQSSKPFKRPFNPPDTSARNNMGNRRYRRPERRAPDYKIHPQNWTRYSLEDCDISESSNCKAAFAFLEERRKLREAEEQKDNKDENEHSDGKFVFKKPKKMPGSGLNSFSSRKSSSSTSKRQKLDGVSIGHLEADADGQVAEAETSKDTSICSDEAESSSKELSSDKTSAAIGFKKGNRKRSIRVRETDDDAE